MHTHGELWELLVVREYSCSGSVVRSHTGWFCFLSVRLTALSGSTDTRPAKLLLFLSPYFLSFFLLRSALFTHSHKNNTCRQLCFILFWADMYSETHNSDCEVKELLTETESFLSYFILNINKKARGRIRQLQNTDKRLLQFYNCWFIDRDLYLTDRSILISNIHFHRIHLCNLFVLWTDTSHVWTFLFNLPENGQTERNPNIGQNILNLPIECFFLLLLLNRSRSSAEGQRPPVATWTHCSHCRERSERKLAFSVTFKADWIVLFWYEVTRRWLIFFN